MRTPTAFALFLALPLAALGAPPDRELDPRKIAALAALTAPGPEDIGDARLDRLVRGLASPFYVVRERASALLDEALRNDASSRTLTYLAERLDTKDLEQEVRLVALLKPRLDEERHLEALTRLYLAKPARSHARRSLLRLVDKQMSWPDFSEIVVRLRLERSPSVEALKEALQPIHRALAGEVMREHLAHAHQLLRRELASEEPERIRAASAKFEALRGTLANDTTATIEALGFAVASLSPVATDELVRLRLVATDRPRDPGFLLSLHATRRGYEALRLTGAIPVTAAEPLVGLRRLPDGKHWHEHPEFDRLFWTSATSVAVEPELDAQPVGTDRASLVLGGPFVDGLDDMTRIFPTEKEAIEAAFRPAGFRFGEF